MSTAEPDRFDGYIPPEDLGDILEGPEPEWASEPEPPPDAERAARMVYRVLRTRRDLARAEQHAQQIRDDVNAWLDRQRRRYTAQLEWVEQSLEHYHRAVLELTPTAKTIHLPTGILASRMGQPEWELVIPEQDDDDGDEPFGEADGPFWQWAIPEALDTALEHAAAEWQQRVEQLIAEHSPLPAAVAVKGPQPPAIARAPMKDALTRRDEKGKAIQLGVTEDGVVPPGLTINPAERTYSVKPPTDTSEEVGP